MTKEEIVRVMIQAAGTNVSKAAMTRALDACLGSIQNAVAEGDKVSLRGFGTFSQVTLAEREGTNPQTKEKIIIPERKRCKFTQAEAFKTMMNE